MANFNSLRILFRVLSLQMKKNATTDDDKRVVQELNNNTIHQVEQAIRDVHSNEVRYQHLTLRFGRDQNIHDLDLSPEMENCLDLYSLYLALRQARFQLETFHPDLISQLVVPLRMRSLLWLTGSQFFDQLLRQHGDAFAYMIPALKVEGDEWEQVQSARRIEQIREHAAALWFELVPPGEFLEACVRFKPDMIKLALALDDPNERANLLPIIRLVRKHRFSWTAGRIENQIELNQCRLLGADCYFGYVSDIPTSVDFHPIDDEEEDEISDEELAHELGIDDETENGDTEPFDEEPEIEEEEDDGLKPLNDQEVEQLLNSSEEELAELAGDDLSATRFQRPSDSE